MALRFEVNTTRSLNSKQTGSDKFRTSAASKPRMKPQIRDLSNYSNTSNSNCKSMNLTNLSNCKLSYDTNLLRDCINSAAVTQRFREELKSADQKPIRSFRAIQNSQKPLTIDPVPESKSILSSKGKDFSLLSMSNAIVGKNRVTKGAAVRPLSSQTTRASNSTPTRSPSPRKNDKKVPSQHNIAVTLSTKDLHLESGVPSPSKYLGDHKNAVLPPFEPVKCSSNQNGVVKAYAANTHQGLIRNYNEDRVAIILNITKPPNVETVGEWPICSFFGVYDGHGGAACADFLRDNLHQYIIRDKNFPSNCIEALKNGFAQAEKQFTLLAQQAPHRLDHSGSCAIVVLIVADTCYVANVGDSRCVMSMDQGKKVIALSRDHKPSDPTEKFRIITAGGKLYQSQIPSTVRANAGNKVTLGPVRVLPGRLSVSRTFGDVEAKLPEHGGCQGVVIAEPEIQTFNINNKEHDFIVLASDGIYDKISNEELVGIIWEAAKLNKATDLHRQSSVCAETLMKEALIRRTMDNISVVMIALNGFSRALFLDPELEDKTLLDSANHKEEEAPKVELISNEETSVADNTTPTTSSTQYKQGFDETAQADGEKSPAKSLNNGQAKIDGNLVLDTTPANPTAGTKANTLNNVAAGANSTTKTNSPPKVTIKNPTPLSLSSIIAKRTRSSQSVRGVRNALETDKEKSSSPQKAIEQFSPSKSMSRRPQSASGKEGVKPGLRIQPMNLKTSIQISFQGNSVKNSKFL